MVDETKIDEINDNIKILLQIQDFNTLQMTIMAILFALFIFSITALITDVSPTIKLMSFIILFFSSMVLYYLLPSIFFNNWELKLENFGLAILFITLTCIYLIIALAIFGLSLWLTNTFIVDNILMVIFLIIFLIISLLIFNGYIYPRYLKRFNLLYKKISKEKKSNFLAIINDIIEKRLARIAYSVLASFFITLFTGLFERVTNNVLIREYGIPFAWLKYQVNQKISEPIYDKLIIDLIFFSVIIYLIISAYEFYILKNKKY